MRNTLTLTWSAVGAIGLLALAGCDSSQTPTATDTPVKYSLNDTGVKQFSSTNVQFVASKEAAPSLSVTAVPDHPGQDANSGRDADPSTNADIDGRAGFSFTKLGADGKPLPSQTLPYTDQPWDCVLDNVTGLTWEVKTPDNGPRYYTNKYTWYDSDTKTNGGNAGSLGDNTLCGKTLDTCNTLEYTKYINKFDNNKGLCGHTDWRVPTREELRSILDYGATASPLIDEAFLGKTEGTDHWTSQTALYNESPLTYEGSKAWELHFDTGESEAHAKGSTEVTIRLVRGP